jgi:hypothetical protein
MQEDPNFIPARIAVATQKAHQLYDYYKEKAAFEVPII